MDMMHQTFTFIQYSTGLFIFLVGTVLIVVCVTFIVDVSQTRHAIRHNFPVVGRFRYWFENMGEFFRQYFFAQDREEMPFNRAERSWVYRAAKGVDNAVAFGIAERLWKYSAGEMRITAAGSAILVCYFRVAEGLWKG